MSYKTAINNIQQSEQTIEEEYDIHVVNRAEELNQRFENKN